MTAICNEEDKTSPEAQEVFVLMKSEYRISRNIRAQWYFRHLNKHIQKLKNCEGESSEEIEIISIIPRQTLVTCSTTNSDYSSFLLVPETKVAFLAKRYRIVFCLDLSPSVATVDIQLGSILFDEIYSALVKCLRNVSKPFHVPGSQYVFKPQLHISVIAHIPYCSCGVPQVLIQGFVLTHENVDHLLGNIQCSLQEVGARIAEATAEVNEEHSRLRTPSDKLTGALFDDIHDGNQMLNSPATNLTADISTVNLLRYGILALQLLPENSSAGIVVITDGILSFPNTQMLESLLTQLRNSTIACSFLQMGSSYHPFTCFGFVPYTELMQFISEATGGAYFSSSLDIVETSEDHEMNAYHKSFLVWNFQNSHLPLLLDESDRLSKRHSYWNVDNQHFYCMSSQPRVNKKHMEGNLKASLENVLSCRLREGYTIRAVTVDEGKKNVEVRLLLPWKMGTNIEYVVLSNWNPSSQRKSGGSEGQSSGCCFEVIVDGCYEFLHDVTCSAKKPIKSSYRSAVVNQFWKSLKNLSYTDQILVHLHSFAHNPVYYTVPESIKNGVPVFYLPTNAANPVLSSKNDAHTQFAAFWKPLCRLDINIWQKWMHTHRIGVILEHDMPLPKNLHLPNSSGRYMQIQCRQAAAALNSLLSEYSSFVLIENHTYIKLLFSEPDKPPVSFYVIRVTSKAPCMVIRLAFLGGSPGFKRNEIVKELRQKILSLKLPKRASAKEIATQLITDISKAQYSGMKETTCCFLLKKPVEKILIRYKRLPPNFMSPIAETRLTNNRSYASHQFTEHMATNMLITLSRYFYHRRWVWTMQSGPNSSLELSAVAKILSALTKIRLQEGFHFAHSSCGIIYMILEIPMKVPLTFSQSAENSNEAQEECHPCVVQYFLFPPYTNTTFKDTVSEEEDTEMPEADGELQLITECWVEPQYGVTTVSSSRLRYLDGLSYKQLADAFYAADLECVSNLVTFEHLCLMCQKKNIPYPPQRIPSMSSDVAASDMCRSQITIGGSTPDFMLSQVSLSTPAVDSSISLVPYSFNLIKLLPKCHQTEMLFASLYEKLKSEPDEQNTSKVNDLLFEYLMENVKRDHDRELLLSIQDCIAFPLQVHHRERIPLKANEVPFSHPSFLESDLFNSTIFVDDVGSKFPCCGRENIPSVQQNGSFKSLCEYMENVEKNVPRWRCFLKECGSSHFILTLIPATYTDLKKLNSNYIIYSNGNDEKANANALYLNSSATCEAAKSVVLNEMNGHSFNAKPTELQEHCKDLQEEKSKENIGSLVLPMYIYDCSLSSVTGQLVQREDKPHFIDSYEDHTFQQEIIMSDGNDYLSVRTDTNSETFKKEDCKRQSDKILLRRHCLLMDKYFSKCFVYGVYRSLTLELDVYKVDVEAVIDRKCEESLLEIDITEFVYMICGHVKDFCMKNSVRQKHLAAGKGSHRKDNSNSSDSYLGQERSHQKCFPLALLQKHQPCEQLQQKHLDIKNKFSDILKCFFRKIPSHEEYYYFYHIPEEVKEDTVSGDNLHDDVTNEEDVIKDSYEIKEATDVEATSVDCYEIASNKESFLDIQDDQGSAQSHANTHSSLSSLDHDGDSYTGHQNKAFLPPLFVHFLCSGRTKHNIRSCSLSSLPTCLSDLKRCLEPSGTDVDLDDLHITLDVTCLTLPPDIECPVVSHQRQYSTSFSSSSPVPESDTFKPHLTDDVESILSDCPTDTVQGRSLQHLPVFQYQAINKCVDKIKWMLQDEIASASLDIYPVTANTLKMVSTHVKTSGCTLCCITKEVPLQFVFSPEISLDKFIQEFKRMSPPGYHLNQEEDYYYLVLDAESAEKLNRPFGSLDPPIIANKYPFVRRNPHEDDSTELKAISNKTDGSMPFANKESITFLRRNSEISSLDDDSKILTLPLVEESTDGSKTAFGVLRENIQFQGINQEDDTETEDTNYCQQLKSRTSRKVTSKCSRDKISMESRASSVPSETLVGKHLPQNSIVGHSAPPEFSFDAISSFKTEKEQGSESPSKQEIILMTQADSSAEFFATSLCDFAVDSNHNQFLDQTNEMVESSAEVPESPPECDSLLLGDLHLSSKESNSTIPSKVYQPDCAESPIVYSEDLSSVIGSGHLSNTEDGYEGDSSDSGSDWDWLNTLDTRHPLLPKFWLIMNICETKVIVFFHMRHRNVEDEELIQSKAILTRVIRIIRNICKQVNQTLLLQDLHDTRMCDQLLLSEDSDDIWKKTDVCYASGCFSLYRRFSTEDADQESEQQEMYLEANLRFMPGAFDCRIVWVTHFILHHRLTTGHVGGVKSRGIQALHTVLNSFSVNNRKNMFVYQERSGSVFYLRLHEFSCDENHHTGKCKLEDSVSLSRSCWTSLQSLGPKKCYVDEEDETEFRSRLNSGHSDKDHHDTASIVSGSLTPKKLQQYIALHVHGIGEVGTEIKEDLVQVLQNRLNEGVLDMIIMMLSRNPLCKLTPEDVQFIQNPNHAPTTQFHFTVPVKLLGYAHSIQVYLRQNLLHFLYNPKYTDSKKENHFKAYTNNPVEWAQVDDNDIFLYYCHQASGYSGSKGIACIILSLVSGQGHPVQHLGCYPPNQTAYYDGLSENEYEELTSTFIYTSKRDTRSPGPVALIRFQIWCVGKISTEQLQVRLNESVRHALWDLLMEYRLLTAPITEAKVQDEFVCFSEPTTPIKVRRTGKTMVDQSLQLKEISSPSVLLTSKEISSSVPDFTKTQSPLITSHDSSVFKFASGTQSAKLEMNIEIPQRSYVSSSSSTLENDKKNLTYIFHSVVKSFLQFGEKLGCPTLSKHSFTLNSRHSVAIILKEMQNIIKGLTRDMHPEIFLRVTNVLNADTEFVPFNAACSPHLTVNLSKGTLDDVKPGTTRNFIIVARNVKQWRAYMGLSDFLKFQESYLETQKTYQRFQTHVCYSSATEKFYESSSGSPTSVNKSNSAVGLVSPHLISPSLHPSDSSTSSQSSTSVPFVPRQRLLIMFVEDKELTMFLYNWAADVTSSLIKQLKRLIQWHHSRDSLVSNIVSQKLGLFHSQTFPYQPEKNEKGQKSETGKQVNALLTWNFVEQLVQYHSPPRDSHTTVTGHRATVSAKTSSVLEVLKNTRPPLPIHLCDYSSVQDPVTKYGLQLQETDKAQRRDMQELHSMWQTRGATFNNPFVDRLLQLLKRVARHSHYCLTPILFSPSWRWKVAPVRDHTLEPFELLSLVSDKSPSDSSLLSRSRHGSGNSVKNSDSGQGVNNNNARSRRASGSAYQGSTQGSPRPRRNTSEEAWHYAVCSHYVQEYIQYLQTLGFVAMQTKNNPRSHRGSLGNDDETKVSKVGSATLPYSRSSVLGPPVYYLIKSLLGGLLVFEVGLCDPYSYCHLYSIECSRLHACSSRALSSQFTAAFLDELDKIKVMMHLHSFTYDYHLRTIHSYISGRQLIFRQGYHLTSFLDDFIKYYQKAPNCARNLIYAGSLTITDTNMLSHQLYNYIISHNQLYGMRVLRMVPIIQDSTSVLDTEFVLVELSTKKASYKDANDVCQTDSFDVGLLITHNTTEQSSDKTILVLNYYIILTSQRELYPKLSNFGTTFGSFQTVRFGSSQNSSCYSSRKTSTVSAINEKDKLVPNLEETIQPSHTYEPRARVSTVRGMCDEEVTYLGYISSQEAVMQQVLQSEATEAQAHLRAVVNRAAIHCRRDFLWSCLLPRSFKDESNNKDGHGSTISYSEFSELLKLVTVVPLDDVDPNLTPFLNMHISWYRTLSNVLKIKYAECHRDFSSADGSIHYMVVTHVRCPDSFMLLSVDQHLKRADLGLVFREPAADMEHTPEKPNQRVLALQSLVEEFVNACCFHLWCGIIN